MNINLTLIGQSITFLIFVWFCMKFVWPFIRKAMDERTQQIAEGLSAAERAHRDLELAKDKVSSQLKDAKVEAASIIEQANRRAAQIIDEAKDRAREEGDRIKASAQAEIEQERNLHYVALTRAKKVLYFVEEPAAGDSDKAEAKTDTVGANRLQPAA